MEFNVKKCKIVHVGHSNPGYKNEINGGELQEIYEEEDIGVIVQIV